MEYSIEELRNCPLFSGISEEELPDMLDCLGAAVVPFRKGDLIVGAGAPAKYLGVILSGAAQMTQTDFFGNKSIIANFGPSELFVESFACAGIDSIPLDVAATEDSRILVVDCLRLLHTCENTCPFHRQVIYNLMRIMAGKNIAFHEKIEITSKRTTRAKVMTYLMLRSREHRSNSFEIPYNRQELADYLEVERSGLSVEISKLCREGVIEAKRKRFRILKSIEY